MAIFTRGRPQIFCWWTSVGMHLIICHSINNVKSKKSLDLLHNPVFSVVYRLCNQEQPEMSWNVFFVCIPNIKHQKLCWINEKTPKWILFFLAIDHALHTCTCVCATKSSAVNNFSFCQLCYQQQSMVLRLWCVIDVSVRETMEGPAEMKWGTQATNH